MLALILFLLLFIPGIVLLVILYFTGLLFMIPKKVLHDAAMREQKRNETLEYEIIEDDTDDSNGDKKTLE
ncbi:MAG: hypothetical protein MJ215_02585 [Spirochaetia bacterium]|nr:hypothetical protein [Spirochaetia bacterium]